MKMSSSKCQNTDASVVSNYYYTHRGPPGAVMIGFNQRKTSTLNS